MKSITEVKGGVYHIVSEPGDATRYDYFVARDGPDEFVFMPYRSTFRFPQRINYYERENLAPIAEQANCNIHTVAECVRTIEELHK